MLSDIGGYCQVLSDIVRYIHLGFWESENISTLELIKAVKILRNHFWNHNSSKKCLMTESVMKKMVISDMRKKSNERVRENKTGREREKEKEVKRAKRDKNGFLPKSGDFNKF